MSPEAMRLEVRFASQPGAGLRGLTRWATLQSQLASSPALERAMLFLSRRLERHADQRPSILSLGRLQDLPPDGQAHYRSGLEV